MDLIQALILGVVQGLTEYLPVSSSAHLVLVPKLMGWHFQTDEAFVFDVLVQMGTLVGVLLYFAKDIYEIAHRMILDLMAAKPLRSAEARLGWLVGIATVPAAMAGLLLKDQVEAFFDSPKAALAFLLATAGILTIAEFLGKRKREQIKLSDAVVVGCSQVVALLPGISRSGATISMGVVLGLSKPAAARFSFLMSIPIMIGAGLIAFQELLHEQQVFEEMLWPILVGMLVSAVTGYFVIKWFLNFLKNQSLLWFALYCALVGGVGLLLV